jgi:hypothetical protein
MLKQFEEQEVLEGRETRGALKNPALSALNPPMNRVDILINLWQVSK